MSNIKKRNAFASLMEDMGGFDAPEPKRVIKIDKIAGLNVPQPKTIIKAGKKSNKKFKDVSKYVDVDVITANSELSMGEIMKQLQAERVKFRKAVARQANQAKKIAMQKGETKKVAREHAAKHTKKMKDELKKLLFKVQLCAHKEFNSKIA